MDYDDSWTGLKTFLKKWQKTNGMRGFELRNDSRLQSDMEQRELMKNKTTMNEGYYPSGKMSSYSDNIPQVKIIIQHTRQIQEGEQRYRNVARIFVENTNGERFLLPTKRPGIAKVYARHIAEGGTPYDDKGTHITSLVEEYTKMAGFVRATKGNQFNESAQRLVNEGVAHYESLRHTLGSMISNRGYHKYFDSYTPVLNEETEDTNTLNELFVQETLDPRIESVLPILQKLSKNLTEMNEVKELSDWAQSITEESAEDDLEEGKLGKALGAAAVGAMMMNPMAKAGGITLDQPGGFSAKDQTTLNQKVEKSQGVEALQKFLAKQGMKQIISGQLDNLTYDNIMKVSQMHDAGKLDSKAAAEFQQLAQGAGLTDLKEGPADAPEHEDTEPGHDDKRFDDIDEGHAYSDRPYVCVHPKKGKCEVHADSSYAAVKKAAQKWGLKSTAGIDAHLADVEHKPVDEDLGPEQKKVGQLGPTEPVGKNEKNLRGKLVGASESVENDELNRIKEMIGYK